MGIDGERWIKGQRKKTGESYSAPLLPQAMNIIEKYRGNLRAEVQGKLLPVVSNQKLNSYLKEIADLCGVDKNITFHLARHTFATTVTLSNGVPLETIGKMPGHASLRSTQVYVKVIQKKVSEDMQVLREKLADTKDLNSLSSIKSL